MGPDQILVLTVCLSGLKYFSGQQKHTFCDYALQWLIHVRSVFIRSGLS